MLTLPPEYLAILWRGRYRAKLILQVIHWDTRAELTEKGVKEVYNALYGEGSGDAIAFELARQRKQYEAMQRLNEDDGPRRKRR